MKILHDTLEYECQDQDQYACILPNGVKIDVCWYPQFRSYGGYHCNVFIKEYCTQNILEKLSTRDLQEVRNWIQNMIFKYQGDKQ